MMLRLYGARADIELVKSVAVAKYFGYFD